MNNKLAQLALEHETEKLAQLDQLSQSNRNSVCDLGWSILNQSEYNWTDDAVTLPKPLAQIRDAIEMVKGKGSDIHLWSDLYANSIKDNEPPKMREGYHRAAILSHIETITAQQMLSTLLIGYQLRQPQA